MAVTNLPPPARATAASSYALLPFSWASGTLLINLACLGLLVWGLVSQAHVGTGGRHLAAAVLLAVAGCSWVVWVAGRTRKDRRYVLAPLAVMAIAGGALANFGPVAVVFVGVAALGTAVERPVAYAAGLCALGWASFGTGAALAGGHFGVFVEVVAATLAGLVVGQARRQAVEHSARLALLQFETQRAEVEGARAELLSERNRLAREIHDVLAHTLSALAVQLEALDSVVQGEAGASPEILSQVQRSKDLVHEGLQEARRAVKALRGAPVPLLDQMSRLAEADGVSLSVSGQARPLSPEASLALYRAAQEGLANVVKHAPGSPAQVTLEFGPSCVSLRVTNPTGPAGGGTLASGMGSGYGLVGMRERFAALGGKVSAGPEGASWQLKVEVPA